MTDEQITEIRKLLEVLQGDPWRRQPLPWRVWTSCSFRRIGCDQTGKDGDVLHAYNQRSDGQPDLSMSEERLNAWVGLTNALPSLIDEVVRLREALRPFAHIAVMEERAGPVDTVDVNVARCRDTRAVLRSNPCADGSVFGAGGHDE
jgi:hypothetical protein